MKQDYKVVFEASAWRQLMKLPESSHLAIFAVIESLEQNPLPSGVVKMEGSDNLYRVRAGNYRVLYQIENAVLTVVVVRVGDRREVYKKR